MVSIDGDGKAHNLNSYCIASKATFPLFIVDEKQIFGIDST